MADVVCVGCGAKQGAPFTRGSGGKVRGIECCKSCGRSFGIALTNEERTRILQGEPVEKVLLGPTKRYKR